VKFPVAVSVLLLLAPSFGHSAAADRPNILWITCEDTSPHLGAYGDTFAVTPNLDAFARESVRYTQAFAYTAFARRAVRASSRASIRSGWAVTTCDRPRGCRPR
jgi:arylsulfatase A-like enzyme